jgi:hypothetical protein
MLPLSSIAVRFAAVPLSAAALLPFPLASDAIRRFAAVRFAAVRQAAGCRP